MKKSFKSGKIWTLLSAFILFMTCGIFMIYATGSGNSIFSEWKTDKINHVLTEDNWNSLMDALDKDAFLPAGTIMAFNLTECPEGWSKYSIANEGRYLMGSNSNIGVTSGSHYQIVYDSTTYYNDFVANDHVNVLYCIKGEAPTGKYPVTITDDRIGSLHLGEVCYEDGSNIEECSHSITLYVDENTPVSINGAHLYLGAIHVRARPVGNASFDGWLDGCDSNVIRACNIKAKFKASGGECIVNYATYNSQNCGTPYAFDYTCGENACLSNSSVSCPEMFITQCQVQSYSVVSPGSPAYKVNCKCV